MKTNSRIKIFGIFFIVSICGIRTNSALEEDAEEYMLGRNHRQNEMERKTALATWGFESNFTEHNRKIMEEAEKKHAEFERLEWDNFKTWSDKWQDLSDPNLRRQFFKYSVQGLSALTDEKFARLNEIIADMSTTYSTAKICLPLEGRETCGLSLEPDLTKLLSTSRDPDLLLKIWQRWREASGSQVRQKFIEYVNLSNEAAQLNNFTDMGSMWLAPYESTDFPDQIEDIWQEILPLYKEVHSYVRRKLRERYGDALIPKGRGRIPAHLLGNMWAQQWTSVGPLARPYPGKASVDVTQSMVQKNFTALKMFKLAEKFFTDLNLQPMTETFWKKSIIEKPKDRDMVCHASAWDFYNGEDVRIKMCTTITTSDLITVHHEMGHIQYYLQYKDQPVVFKTGANPGFHEAVGDSLALSVQTPKHLSKIGLLDTAEADYESQINFLFEMALQKIVFLPFAYVVDKYRWNVFNGQIPSTELNAAWWKLRNEIQGLDTPVGRSEEDFDAGAKYHVVANVPYIRYFVSFVVQFQFHKALCLAAGEYDSADPMKALHNCDIDKSAEAGRLFADMLKLGASRPWPEALEALTGTRKMDASVLREYFRPLEDWLREDNRRNGEVVGWEED